MKQQQSQSHQQQNYQLHVRVLLAKTSHHVPGHNAICDDECDGAQVIYDDSHSHLSLLLTSPVMSTAVARSRG